MFSTKRQNNILILSNYFPPHKDPQAKNNLSLVYTMMDRGFYPIVVASEVPKNLVDNAFLKLVDNIKIFRYPAIQSDTFIKRIRGKLQIPYDQNVFSKISRRMFKTAQKAIKKNDVNVIYSISPMGEAHKVGLMLTQKYGIPWVAEFRDPWLDNQTLMEWIKDNSCRLYRYFWMKKANSLLKQVLENANLVVTGANGHLSALTHRAKMWGINKDKIIYTRLGCDPKIIDELGTPNVYKVLEKSQIPKIGFVGKVYYGYEERARRLIRCLHILEQEGTQFCFITVGCSVLPRLASEEGLNSILPVHTLPYKEAIGIMKVLDWGVTIPSSNINSNHKLYEYLLQGCPVIVWGCPEGEMALIVRKHNCGIVIDDSNEKKAASELRKCILKFKEKKSLLTSNDDWFTRRKCFEPVIERIFDIISNSH